MDRVLRGICWIALCIIAATIVLPAVAISVRGFREEIFKADIGAVFGASLKADGTPSAALAGRLDRAAELYAMGAFDTVIVSGGRDGSGPSEADAMADYLIAHGVPASAVVRDTSGTNTRSTAEFVGLYARDRRLTSAIAISQFYHIARAVSSLKDAGLERVGCSFSRRFGIADILSLLREVPAIFAYSLGFK